MIAAFLLFGWLIGGAQVAQAAEPPPAPNRSSVGGLTGGVLDLAAGAADPRRSAPARPSATPKPPGVPRPSAHRPPRRAGLAGGATPRAGAASDRAGPTGRDTSTRSPDAQVERSRGVLDLLTPALAPAAPGSARRIELTPAGPTLGRAGAAAGRPMPSTSGPLTGVVDIVRRAGTVPLVPVSALCSLSSGLIGTAATADGSACATGSVLEAVTGLLDSTVALYLDAGPPNGQESLGLADDASPLARSVLETCGPVEQGAVAGELRPGATGPRFHLEPVRSGSPPPASHARTRSGRPDTPSTPPEIPGNRTDGRWPSLKPAPDAVGDLARTRVTRPDGSSEPVWHVLAAACDIAAGDPAVSPD